MQDQIVFAGFAAAQQDVCIPDDYVKRIAQFVREGGQEFVFETISFFGFGAGLSFGLLEGGVGWACSLYADLLSHWEKRNRVAIHDLDPARIDVPLLMELFAKYGDERFRADLAGLAEAFPPARAAALLPHLTDLRRILDERR